MFEPARLSFEGVGADADRLVDLADMSPPNGFRHTFSPKKMAGVLGTRHRTSDCEVFPLPKHSSSENYQAL